MAGEKFKKSFLEEKEKLKKMTPPDRRWYIWNYYRVPILIGLVVLFILYQAGGAFLRSRQDCMLYCAFINQTPAGESQLARLKDDFYARENFGGLQVITFDTSINLTDDLYSDASSIVFQSLTGTDTVDIVITKQSIMEQYHNQNVFLDLQDLLPPQDLELLETALYCDPETSNPIGIYLKNSILPSAYGLDEDSILGVCTLNNHPDVIQDFLSFIFHNSSGTS
ncbi:MAG: hypothetical protein K2G51_01060 [Lachnospiraceae bacterium]|nr:hypothetical protein [Lachnospiraceae bacterium]